MYIIYQGRINSKQYMFGYVEYGLSFPTVRSISTCRGYTGICLVNKE